MAVRLLAGPFSVVDGDSIHGSNPDGDPASVYRLFWYPSVGLFTVRGFGLARIALDGKSYQCTFSQPSPSQLFWLPPSRALGRYGPAGNAQEYLMNPITFSDKEHIDTGHFGFTDVNYVKRFIDNDEENYFIFGATLYKGPSNIFGSVPYVSPLPHSATMGNQCWLCGAWMHTEDECWIFFL